MIKQGNKLYKYISIISFSIVVMLICNLILPVFTKAENTSTIVLDFEEDLDNNKLNITGTIPDDYVKYDLYWANGELPIEKPAPDASDEEKQSFVNNVIDWFVANKVKDKESVEGSTKINSQIDIIQGNKYSVLCVAYITDRDYMIKWKSRKTSVQIETTNTINLKLTSEGKRINISVSDSKSSIELIKFAKSDKQLKCEDFATMGETLTFEGNNNISISKEVVEDGTYYVYAKNKLGAQSVEGIVINNVKPVENDIELDVYKLKNNERTIVVRANSKTGNIQTIKYLVTDNQLNAEKEEDRNNIVNNGKNVGFNAKQKVGVIVSDDNFIDGKNLAVYAESTDGRNTYTYWKCLGTVGALGEIEADPIVDENEKKEEIPEENKPEENKPEEEQPEENKPEENKPEEEQPEENKPEENKPEENKPEEEQPEENKPEEEQPEENKPEEEQPEENQPEGNKPEENKPEETQPEENKPEENKPEEEQPEENRPEESKPEEEQPEENRPEESKPEEEQPEENKPEENKPEESKPEENKPTENKPDNSENKEESGDKAKEDEYDDLDGKNPNKKPEQSESSSSINLPQTGTNNSITFIGIAFFATLGIFSIIKYKKGE